MPIHQQFVAFCLCLAVVLAGAARGESTESFTNEQIEFFEKKIRPVLAQHCYSCHSHEAERNRGGFYMDSREGIIDAFLAEPGQPGESLMIEAVHYNDPTMQMPPSGKLPDNVIQDLEEWVKMGLPWPEESGPKGAETFDLEARQKAHWAWSPPKRSEHKDKIDAFVDAKLAEQGLEPAPAADHATLIRRVTLDLTGLPPTPQEIDAFINDTSPDAYEKLVDHLLASPRYGEKWARHWLDLMRYAESYGHEFDYSIPHAWKYRDYVIRALNDDIPYDRLVQEHIAGDLIEPRIHPQTQVNEAIKATGWWFLHEQVHSPTDVRLHEHERMDNQIDVLSKSFLGVTVACARCHDHKFDAISDEDYYSLMGFLQSSRQQEAYLDPGGKIAEAAKQAHGIRDQAQAVFDKLDAPKLRPTQTEDADTELFEDFNEASFGDWFTSGWAWGDRPTAPGQWDATTGQATPVLPGVAHSGSLGDRAVGTLRSQEFDLVQPSVWIRVKGKGKARLIIDSFTMARHNALLFEGLDLNIDTQGQWWWVRLASKRDFYHGNGNHRAHLEFIDDRIDAHLQIDEIRFGPGLSDRAHPREEPDFAVDAADHPDAPPHPAGPSIRGSVNPQQDPVFATLTYRLREVMAKAPDSERVLAITDGTGEDSYLHIRGGWHGKGEDLPRRFLTALGGEDGTVIPQDRSGRDDLAKRITDPANPLTARVQVNRLWHHLFGRGLVPTTDNFGVLGSAPSHPELLDHLAVVFIEDDQWSTKAMIKRIVMSEVYQRTSDKQNKQAEEQDPQNLLLRRQNIRRMTAETIRDSVLFAAGELDEKQFGPSVPVHLTAFMQGRGKPERSGPLDGAGRRSIYTSVRRNFLPPMMLTFDTPIPFSTVGKRNVTIVPAQSLTLMNDPLVHDQAEKWAKRLLADGSESVDQRLDMVFMTAISRKPTEDERRVLSRFIASHTATSGNPNALKNEKAWREVCHAVYNLKGFVYVR